MGQLKCISRSGMRVFFAEEVAFKPLEDWYTHTGAATFSSIENCEYFYIDGGGSVSMNEPKISVEANGVQFKMYLRHAPYIVEMLRNCNEDKIKGCVLFTGWPNALYSITLETRDVLVQKLDELSTQNREQINKIEDDLANAWKQAGGLYLGKCSCQSGQPYKVCCGNRN